MVSGYCMGQLKSKVFLLALKVEPRSGHVGSCWCLPCPSGFHRVPLVVYLRRNPESLSLTDDTTSTPITSKIKLSQFGSLKFWKYVDVCWHLLCGVLNLCFVWLQDLYEAGEKRWGTDEVKFLTVLCSRNRNHLLHGKALASSSPETVGKIAKTVLPIIN